MGLKSYISSPYIKHQYEWDEIITSYRIFENDKPLNIEIGPGKGKSLLNLGDRFPEKNFVGMEKTPRCLKEFRRKAEKKRLSNIFVFHCFIEKMLEANVTDNSIENFIVFFPDPWPKKKHRKRRFLRKKGLSLLETKLKKNGKIFIKTDFMDYWVEILGTIRELRGLFLESFGKVKSWQSPFNVPTNYEQKYYRMGKEPFYLVVQKI